MRFMAQRVVRSHWKFAQNLLVYGETHDGNEPCRFSYQCLQLVLASNIDSQMRNRDFFVRLAMICCLTQLGVWLVPPNYGFGFGRTRGVQELISVTHPSIFWYYISISDNHIKSNYSQSYAYDILIWLSSHHGTI